METRLTAGFHVKHGNDDDLLIEHREDVEPALNAIARLRSIPQRRTKSGMRRVASLPNVVYYDWLRKGIIQDPVRFRQALDEYKKLKLVEDRLWVPSRVQKAVFKERGIIV